MKIFAPLFLLASFAWTSSTASRQPAFVYQSSLTEQEDSLWSFVSEREKPFLLQELTHGKIRFDGDQVLRLHLATDSQRAWFSQYSEAEGLQLDVWKEENGKNGAMEVEVRVPSLLREAFQEHLQQTSVSYDVVVENVQTLVDQEHPTEESAAWGPEYDPAWLQQDVDQDPFFHRYHSYDEIVQFLQVIHQEYPNITELVEIGQSFEGRTTYGIRIHGSSIKPGKGMVYHGGQHAREWIGVAVNCFLLRQLVTQYGKQEEITKLVDTFEYTIIPVMNVDGYLYSHEKNRMWRKNRQPNGRSWCMGTDTNRNWDQAWNSGGSSNSPCSDAFHGPAAFSAPEPKAIADYIESRKNVNSYIDFHAYSQLWMIPYGSSCKELPADQEALMQAGEASVSALQALYGTRFKVGNVCRIIYQASGGSLDWSYEKANVKYSFGVELRDTGLHGFLLPPDQILPSGQETLAAIVALGNFIMEKESIH